MFITYPRKLQTVNALSGGFADKNATIIEMLAKRGVRLATDSAQVEIMFKKPKLSTNESTAFLLNPIVREDALPIMTLTFDLRGSSNRTIGLRALIFKTIGKQFFLQGYRFESPTHGQAAHGYYHAQHITDLSPSFERFNGMAARWVPASLPAFCLDATNCVQLVVALLVSLYGLTEVQQKLRGDKAARDASKYYLDKMHVAATMP